MDHFNIFAIYDNIINGIEEKPLDHQEHRRLRPNRHRNRGYALEEVNNLSDSEFQCQYRMNRAGFGQLLELIDHYMYEIDEEMAKLSSGSCISKKYMILMKDFQDITFAYGVSRSSFFSTGHSDVILPTLEAIDLALDIIFEYQLWTSY